MQSIPNPDVPNGSRGIPVLMAVSCFLALGELGWAADWPHVRTHGAFRVHADFPLDRLDPLLQELTHLQRELHSRLPLAPSMEVIDVYLFARKETYQQYMQRHFAGLTPRRAMFIKANSPGNVFAFVSEELATDLRHECTHAILHASLPLVPLWLDEGLAEYFEVPATLRAFDHPHMAATRRGILWGRPPALKRLEALEDLSDMGTREYQESWAWVHFFLHGPPSARDELVAYLSEVQRGGAPRPLSERVATRFPRADREFVDHFRRWTR